jgi:hypothetical protein
MIFQVCSDGGVLGSSGYGKTVLTADMHTVIKDILGFQGEGSRSQAKKYTFLLQFGGDVQGCAKYLMAEGYSESQAQSMAEYLIRSYKGHRKGNYYYGGLASAGYNAVYNISTAQQGMKSLLLNRKAPHFLQPGIRGNNFRMTVGNWPIQGTGSDFLRMHFAITRLLAEDCGLRSRPAVSIHDMLAIIVEAAQTDLAQTVMQAAHLVCVARLYVNTGYKECPEKFALFEDVSVDQRLRLTCGDPMVTPTNPNGFE